MTGGVTFIVRLTRDDAGRLSGIVERVRTGHKERFEGVETLSRVIARMVASDPTPTPHTQTEDRP